MSDFQQRLDKYLSRHSLTRNVEQLTPDPSTREYFRIKWTVGTAIACVYPEPFVAGEQSYLDVSKVFEIGGLPVANVYDHNEDLGVIVQEDLGNTILRDVINGSRPDAREKLIDEAIGLIA